MGKNAPAGTSLRPPPVATASIETIQSPSPRVAGEALPDSTAAFCIAGIGASAGGLEALCDFFRAMPEKSNIAFVVIQHLHPSQKSLAAEIIGKHTSIRAIAAAEGMRVEPDTIYTIPPNVYPSLSNGRLHFEQPIDSARPRLPIDYFLASLGNDQRERAIGIILSGSGTDGSLGIRQIEANGGIVLAQSLDTAQFDSMPRSAIGTGLVHCVLPVAEMPAVLVRYASHDYVSRPARSPSKESGQGSLESILKIVQNRVGYNFNGYKNNMLMRRVRRRMSLRSLAMAKYISLLDSDLPEIEALFKDLLIGVTEFFRDPEAWKELKTHVAAPLVEAKKPGETIRIWVPGCSTGEEAYTVAMIMLEQLREAGKSCPLLVFATDTNEHSLQHGRLGKYPSGITTQIPAEQMHRYFTESTANHHYSVTKALRDSVVFCNQNVMSDPPFSRIDLICCRNLLIYLEPDVQKKIILLFRFALSLGGYLFLGSAETIGKHAEAFKAIVKKWRIFKYTGGYVPSDIQLPVHQFGKSMKAIELPPNEPAKCFLPSSQLARLTQQLLLDRFSPAAVLVNASLETLYFSGPTENYLQMPRGTPTHDLLAQTRDGLRSRLRSALHQAISDNVPIVVNDARVRRDTGFQPVRVSIVPTPSLADERGRLFLIVFEEQMAAGETVSTGNESTLVKQLEDELRLTRDDLKNSIERLETSNEELTVSNEEVVSINEELQSINEELESSKEELQSLNEELTTVNQQLQMKVAELETSNSDISNLLSSSQIATLCLDRDFRIKWFSPSMKAIGNIIASDVGRLITDFSPTGLGGKLVEDASSVLETLTSKQCELLLPDERWYIRRVVPYRSDSNLIHGVVITYSDITEAKAASLKAADALRAMAASLEDRVRERTVQLRTLTAELALTEERERRILARDLHDDLGQVLAIVKIKLTSLEECERRGALKNDLNEIETLIDQANRSVRSLMTQLNPPELQALGLGAALEWLGEEMERLYGLAVRLENTGDLPVLKEPQRTTVFRAVRELLVNVSKHAKTDVALIRCHCTSDGRAQIEVIDRGLGFDYHSALTAINASSHFGLISVRDRIEYIGGNMHVDSVSRQGTTVTISLPVPD